MFINNLPKKQRKMKFNVISTLGLFLQYTLFTLNFYSIFLNYHKTYSMVQLSKYFQESVLTYEFSSPYELPFNVFFLIICNLEPPNLAYRIYFKKLANHPSIHCMKYRSFVSFYIAISNFKMLKLQIKFEQIMSCKLIKIKLKWRKYAPS